jgi:hypothetical protein
LELVEAGWAEVDAEGLLRKVEQAAHELERTRAATRNGGGGLVPLVDQDARVGSVDS